MNDEIKEILDNLKEWSVDGNLYFEINDEKAKKLYKYITNLQQENQEMKTNTIPTLKDNIDALVDEVDELIDYKSRCEKANELLKYYDPEPWSTYQITGGTLLNLLNILQGENNGN